MRAGLDGNFSGIMTALRRMRWVPSPLELRLANENLEHVHVRRQSERGRYRR
jgi:hypothetical protein